MLGFGGSSSSISPLFPVFSSASCRSLIGLLFFLKFTAWFGGVCVCVLIFPSSSINAWFGWDVMAWWIEDESWNNDSSIRYCDRPFSPCLCSFFSWKSMQQPLPTSWLSQSYPEIKISQCWIPVKVLLHWIQKQYIQ